MIIYKENRNKKMRVAKCHCCGKTVNTFNIETIAINGVEEQKNIDACLKCLYDSRAAK